MSYLIFLDIDGVFATERVHQTTERHNGYFWSQFDPIAVQLMNKLYYTYQDVQFVISSSWRNHANKDDPLAWHLLYSTFASAGFKGPFARPWCTKNLGALRALEINAYLQEYPGKVDDFLIFDDVDHNFNTILGKKRFIHTDPVNGILAKQMLNTFSVTGTWLKRNHTNPTIH